MSLLLAVACSDAEEGLETPGDELPLCEQSEVPGFPAWAVDELPTGTRIVFDGRDERDGTLVFTANDDVETTVRLGGHLLPPDLRIPEPGESFAITNVELGLSTTARYAYYRYVSGTNGLWAEGSSLFTGDASVDASRFRLVRRADTPLCESPTARLPYEIWVAGADTDDGLVELDYNRTTVVSIDGRSMTFGVASAGRFLCDCTDGGDNLGGWAFVYQAL